MYQLLSILRPPLFACPKQVSGHEPGNDFHVRRGPSCELTLLCHEQRVQPSRHAHLANLLQLVGLAVDLPQVHMAIISKVADSYGWSATSHRRLLSLLATLAMLRPCGFGCKHGKPLEMVHPRVSA